MRARNIGLIIIAIILLVSPYILLSVTLGSFEFGEENPFYSFASILAIIGGTIVVLLLIIKLISKILDLIDKFKERRKDLMEQKD